MKDAWGSESSSSSQLKVHKKRRKGSKKRYVEEKVEQASATTWSVSSTSQWQYPNKRVIQNGLELMQLDSFVSMKVSTSFVHTPVSLHRSGATSNGNCLLSVPTGSKCAETFEKANASSRDKRKMKEIFAAHQAHGKCCSAMVSLKNNSRDVHRQHGQI